MARPSFLGVCVVAGVDAHDLNPFGSFQGSFGFEVDVGDDRHQTALGAEFGDDMLEVGGVFDGRRGNANDLASDVNQVQCLANAFRSVHRIAGDHGLDGHRVVPTDDQTAFGRVTDNDFAGLATPIIKKGQVRRH